MEGSGSWRVQIHRRGQFQRRGQIHGAVRFMEGSDLWRGQIYGGSDSKQGSDIRRDQILGWSHIHRLGVRFMEGSDS